MSVASNVSSVTTQVSGAVTIGSALSSKTAEFVSSQAPEAVETAVTVMSTSEKLGIASFIVMVISAVYNVYSNRRKTKHDERMVQLRERELALRERELELKTKSPD